MSSTATASADSFSVDTSLLSSLDRRFVAVLALSMGAHFAAAAWVQAQPSPVDREEQADALDRFAPVSVSPLRPIPHFAPAASAAATVAPRPAAHRPGTAGPTDVTRTGLLQVLGQESLAGLLTDDATVVTAALDGARVTSVAELRPAPRQGAQTGERAELGSLGATTGSQPLAALERHDALLKGRVDDTLVEVDEPGVDPGLLQRYIAARRTALQSCYERELSRHRALKGKLLVRLSIATNGRARGVEVGDESMGSPEVAACVRSTVERWTFPVKPETEVPLAFPLVFSPAS